MKSFIKKKISLSDTYCSLVQHSLVALGTSCWKYVHKYVPCSTEQLVNLAILSNLLWKVCLSFDSPNVGQKLRVTFLANFTNWHFPTGFNCLFTRTRTAVLLPPHSISFLASFFFIIFNGLGLLIFCFPNAQSKRRVHYLEEILFCYLNCMQTWCQYYIGDSISPNL